jgi:hypothetical protein
MVINYLRLQNLSFPGRFVNVAAGFPKRLVILANFCYYDDHAVTMMNIREGRWRRILL